MKKFFSLIKLKGKFEEGNEKTKKKQIKAESIKIFFS